MSLREAIDAAARGQDVPAELLEAAFGEIMGVRHGGRPIEGVQFHPESILTTEGKKLLSNYLESCN